MNTDLGEDAAFFWGVRKGARAQRPSVGKDPGPGSDVKGSLSLPARSCSSSRRACVLRFRFHTVLAVSCLNLLSHCFTRTRASLFNSSKC